MSLKGQRWKLKVGSPSLRSTQKIEIFFFRDFKKELFVVKYMMPEKPLKKKIVDIK